MASLPPSISALRPDRNMISVSTPMFSGVSFSTTPKSEIVFISRADALVITTSGFVAAMLLDRDNSWQTDTELHVGRCSIDFGVLESLYLGARIGFLSYIHAL